MLKIKIEKLKYYYLVVLVGLMYHTPAFLKDLTNNMIGRSILVVVLHIFTLMCDFSCANYFVYFTIVYSKIQWKDLKKVWMN